MRTARRLRVCVTDDSPIRPFVIVSGCQTEMVVRARCRGWLSLGCPFLDETQRRACASATSAYLQTQTDSQVQVQVQVQVRRNPTAHINTGIHVHTHVRARWSIRGDADKTRPKKSAGQQSPAAAWLRNRPDSYFWADSHDFPSGVWW